MILKKQVSVMEHISQTKSLDRRQKKTRQAIQTALMALMKDKPLEKITVSELAATADVNRKTFYNHYSSIQEVRKELDQQYIDMLFSFMEDVSVDDLTADPSPFIKQLVEAMVKQPVRARLIFESGEHLYLTERLKVLLLPYLSQLAEQHHKRPEYLPYALEYVVYGMAAVLNAWVHAEHPVSPQELSVIASSLLQSSASIPDFV